MSADATASGFEASSNFSAGAVGAPCSSSGMVTAENAMLADEDFYMYTFKVAACPDPESHDCQECPLAHPQEKATRRDPRVHMYTGVSCPSYRKGSCKDGDACRYAHGVFEVWLHPSRFRTELCKDGLSCTRKCCFFAHTSEQLREPSPQDPSLPVPSSKKPAGMKISHSSSNASSACSILDSTGSTGSMVCSKGRTLSGGAHASPAGPLCKPLSRSMTPTQAQQQEAVAIVGQRSLLVQQPHMRGLPSVPAPQPVVQQCRAPATELTASFTPAILRHNMQQQTTSAGGAAGAGDRLLSVPPHIAAEAALVAAAAGAHSPLPTLQLSTSSGTFQAVDHTAALAAAGAALVGASAGLHTLTAALDLTAGSAALTAPACADHATHTGVASACPLAATAASAYQLITAQQQELAAAALLQQMLLPQQQQQGQQLAMWTAAFDAAAGVGLQPYEAAACADIAVQQATAGQPPVTLSMPCQDKYVGPYLGTVDSTAQPVLQKQVGNLWVGQPTPALEQQSQAALALLLSSGFCSGPAHHKLPGGEDTLGPITTAYAQLGL